MEYFDKHHWHPGLYKTEKEIIAAFDSFGIKGKEIDVVHVIGLAKEMIPGYYETIAYQNLKSAGVQHEKIVSGRFQLDDILMPHKVTICEPVVIVFTDGTTFELMPAIGKGLLMSVNQISPTVIDGTNNQNFDSGQYFNCLQGRIINDMEIKSIKHTTAYITRSRRSKEKSKRYIYQILLNVEKEHGSYGFRIGSKEGGWFTFEITHGYVNEPAEIPYSVGKTASKDLSQVPIIEGHDYHEYFWIMPVKPSKKALCGMKNCLQEEISIADYYIEEYLEDILRKHFDNSFPYKKYVPERPSNQFEWYLEDNLYTYETMEKMLKEIEESMNTQKSIETIDFYKRFIRRMKAMMDNNPDYHYISFMGP